MFPDGGIARMRAYGVAVAALPESPHSLVDLSAATNGGVSFFIIIVIASLMFLPCNPNVYFTQTDLPHSTGPDNDSRVIVFFNSDVLGVYWLQ